MIQVVIVLAHNTHLNLLEVRKLLSRHMAQCCFSVMRAPHDTQERLYKDIVGYARAEELAVRAARRFHTPLAIGVVAVRRKLKLEATGIQAARMEIAVPVERGELKDPIDLTPNATHNACTTAYRAGWFPHETEFAQEGAKKLALEVQIRHRLLHLI